MATTTVTSREFNQDTGRNKMAARAWAGLHHVIAAGRRMSCCRSIQHRRLTGGSLESWPKRLAQPGNGDFAFQPPRLRGGLTGPVDLVRFGDSSHDNRRRGIVGLGQGRNRLIEAVQGKMDRTCFVLCVARYPAVRSRRIAWRYGLVLFAEPLRGRADLAVQAAVLATPALLNQGRDRGVAGWFVRLLLRRSC